MQLKCILAMVKPNLTDKVVDAAKAVGATGATIMSASGTGIREAKSFFGLCLDVRTDIILFLVNEETVSPVIKAVEQAGKFHEPGTGIAFVLPVDQAVGLQSQFRNEEK
ncbi:nitrogen regulatory protein P-II family [Paucidesulfovibrio gracilis DSM 16080]|uniref:Nitrogen regulatory protein P-II family n=1 Tax=Paucidesulfovibrio gracilis DSM 16080 TaxID=1121449 RepID=A0A1T4Y7B3_9BACT|nr:P-II family nitrogen regulator [Paucidesulfovibrio gracilis]SKA97610.1 nitrogen regulatory protein P-II family [Paucidesulfovibrio gracilis DSM 16080]